MEFKPSKYQQAIFDAWETTNSNILVEAVAGSGKTTTIVELMRKIKSNKIGMYVAFNKHIVEEIKAKNPPENFLVGTLHSRGYQSIMMNHKGKVKLDEWKTFKLIKTYFNWKDVPRNKLNSKIYNICDFYNYYRLTNQKDLTNFFDIVTKYDLFLTESDITKVEDVINLLNNYNTKHHAHKEFIIDYVDMIYLPVSLNFFVKQVDILMVDEAQDLSAIQHMFINKMMKKTSRIIVVGDPYQSIYGFSGSDINSWDKFNEMENTIKLPLSYCYRCGKKIVELSNKTYDIMESPDWIHDGEVVENGDFINLKPGEFVLCRNTKPLVELYFNLLKLEKPCYIKGSDIGKGLVKVLSDYQNMLSISAISEMHRELEVLRKHLTSIGVKNPTKNQKYISQLEKIEIITLFSAKYKTTNEITNAINNIFKEDGEGIILSTVHKAKGLENDVVYVYLPDLFPSKHAKLPWELVQESNLYYVALTRAKKKLIFVREVFIV
jgi:DNA helicase II / ATP-dependent DNA helicase PcrA